MNVSCILIQLIGIVFSLNIHIVRFSVVDLKGIQQQPKRFSLPRQNNSGLIPIDGAVHIQVGLYHGERCLQDDLCTSSKVLEHESQISWREEIKSRIMIKDLPKVV